MFLNLNQSMFLNLNQKMKIILKIDKNNFESCYWDSYWSREHPSTDMSVFVVILNNLMKYEVFYLNEDLNNIDSFMKYYFPKEREECITDFEIKKSEEKRKELAEKIKKYILNCFIDYLLNEDKNNQVLTIEDVLEKYMKDTDICYDCYYLGFDSCCNGYCSNRIANRDISGNLVITDKGCTVKHCDSFKKRKEEKE